MKRAVVAAFGWPANLQQDAVYPYTEVDSTRDRTLTGANKYTLTFAKGETPPVNGFWSITMYEIDKGWWFVPNPLNKFTVSPRNNLEVQRRRFADALLPERVAGQGQGSQLAAGARRAISSRCCACTGRRTAPLDPERHLESSSGKEGKLNSYKPYAVKSWRISGSGPRRKYSLRADVFRCPPDSRHSAEELVCPFCADSVEKVFLG